MIPPVPAPAAASPGVHGGGARPAGDPAGEHAGGGRRVAERAVGHVHVGDVGHVRAGSAPTPRTRVPRGRARRPCPSPVWWRRASCRGARRGFPIPA